MNFREWTWTYATDPQSSAITYYLNTNFPDLPRNKTNMTIECYQHLDRASIEDFLIGLWKNLEICAITFFVFYSITFDLHLHSISPYDKSSDSLIELVLLHRRAISGFSRIE